MATIRDHVERIKAKPEPVRRQIALSVAGGFTGVVALFWAVATIGSGTLALNSDNFGTAANAGNGLASATKDLNEDFGSLVGAAAASQAQEGGLTVIETRASSTTDRANAGEDTRTVIPF